MPNKYNLIAPTARLKLATIFISSHFLIFSVMKMFYYLGDAIMSYMAPLMISENVSSAFLMGLVIAISSFCGFFCDFLFAQNFRGKHFAFFYKYLIILAISFPAILIIFPEHLLVFMGVMIIWGIYYEFGVFANFHFIEEKVKMEEHAQAWGLVEITRAFAYSLGPIIAGFLLLQSNKTALLIALFFFLLSATVFKIYLWVYPPKKVAEERAVEKLRKHCHSRTHFKVWLTLFRRIWPIYLFLVLLFLIDSCFWTVGVLLSEEVKAYSFWGSFILPAYTLPSLFLGFLAGIFAKPFGKKKIAFGAALLGGICFALLAFVSQPILMVLLVFVASCFISLAWPQILATFEDYVVRLKEFGVDMVALQGSTGSLSYVLGPIVAGFLASLLGNKTTFIFMGILLFIFSFFLLIFLPRKIRMPQAELEEMK